jgi:hypothetical protein
VNFNRGGAESLDEHDPRLAQQIYGRRSAPSIHPREKWVAVAPVGLSYVFCRRDIVRVSAAGGAMASRISNATGWCKTAVERWFDDRRLECRRYCDCQHPVGPWDEFCSHCGRGNPAKASAWSGIVLVVGALILLLMISAVSWVF